MPQRLAMMLGSHHQPYICGSMQFQAMSPHAVVLAINSQLVQYGPARPT